MTNQKALRLLEISKEYLPKDKLKEFIARLDREYTTNDTFKQSLKTLLEPPKKPKWVALVFYTLVVTHFTLVCGVGVSFLLLPFLAPWYIALPLMVFIWFFGTTKVECKLTDTENYLRKQLGMKPIGGFVGHYFRKPTKMLWNKFNQYMERHGQF